MIGGNIIRKGAGAASRVVGETVRHAGSSAANLGRRALKRRLPDHVVINLNREIVEREPAAPWWHDYVPGLPSPISIEELGESLWRIAGDPDVKGVVFLVESAALSLAQAQSVADLFARFQEWDAAYNGQARKEITVYLEHVDAPGAVMASAAHRVVMPPLGDWSVLGLQIAPTFFKDTLAKLGVEFDVIKIAPWKTAADTLSRSEMSPEQRAQYDWLLDSIFDELVAAVSAGRNLDADVVRALIDRAPLTAEQALNAGLIDVIAYEDELPALLGSADKPATLKPYEGTHLLLYHHAERPTSKAVGVISLEGAIMTGKSRSFPVPLPIFGERTIGSATAQQQIRAARKNDHLGAVILHVDSGGGSALASDLIWRELKQLDAEKPVVVYMGDVAASGGYYIATPGRKIVAQPSTLTGSIGVIMAKPVTAGMVKKVGARKEIVRRGEHAGIYGGEEPWTGDQRATMEEGVQYVYRVFKERVADGRNLEFNGLDEIANGRVWTGAQALEHGLIDATGDFQAAVEMARDLGDLEARARVRTVAVTPQRKSLLAMPVEAVQAVLGVTRLYQVEDMIAGLAGGDLAKALLSERYWLIADDLPRVE